MKMSTTEKGVLMLSSLSVFRNILKDEVCAGFYELLKAHNKTPRELMYAWGSFAKAFSESENSEKGLVYHFTKTAVLDNNEFTRLLAEDKPLPDYLKENAARDLAMIPAVAMISGDLILKDSQFSDDIAQFTDTLPKWISGAPFEPMLKKGICTDILKELYKNEGYWIFYENSSFSWRQGEIIPVKNPDQITEKDLKGYEKPRGIVEENIKAFIEGKTANNCLLYGSKGTGKSSTIKVLADKYSKDGIRIIEIPKEELGSLHDLCSIVGGLVTKFILFIDDLSFEKSDQSYMALKAMLEGGLSVLPENVIIMVTSNRRHLIRETFANANAKNEEIHPGDTREESLSLYDRFGLAVNFSQPDKNEYLYIVKKLAEDRDIEMDEQELYNKAERWALLRGGRSPRCARQFIDSLYLEKKRED